MVVERGKVLILDDEEAIRRFLHQKLSSEGYQCQEAGNAEHALYNLRKNAIGLVILDIRMPGKSGIELLPEIKTNYPDTTVVIDSTIILPDGIIFEWNIKRNDFCIR